MKINTLPNEVLANVFQHLIRNDGVTTNFSDLLTCLVVCKKWNLIATPLMYRAPYCKRITQLDQLSATLTSDSAAAAWYKTHVQKLAFSQFVAKHVDDARFSVLLNAVGPHLRSIYLSSTTSITRAGLMTIAETCHQLESFSAEELPLRIRFDEQSWMYFFQNCGRLREICLYGCTRLTDDSFQVLVQRGMLEKLMLVSCDGITDKTVDRLLEHGQKLKSVHIASRSIPLSDRLHNLARRCRKVYICVQDKEDDLGLGLSQKRRYQLSRNISKDDVAFEFFDSGHGSASIFF
jgi:hypothetical protein